MGEDPRPTDSLDPLRCTSSEKESVVTVPLEMMSLISIRGRSWVRPLLAAHPT